MTQEKTVLEMAQELGLNMENIEAGLKSNPKEVGETVTRAYEFKMKFQSILKR